MDFQKIVNMVIYYFELAQGNFVQFLYEMGIAPDVATMAWYGIVVFLALPLIFMFKRLLYMAIFAAMIVFFGFMANQFL